MSVYVDIKKKMGDFQLEVSFSADTEVFALLGASGCGKSMTLKCIAGIEQPDSGIIKINDRVVYDSQKGIHVPARERRCGYLFQDYALFPNMTVYENINCIAKDKEETKRLIQRFYLTGKEKLYPGQLSGGQKQRAALARMLAFKPDIIMFDEPFSALDSYIKWQLEKELSAVIREYNKTVLYVSHDRDEVYRLTDRISVMEEGRILEIKEKAEFFERPETLAAALLTGCKNFSRVETVENNVYRAVDWNIRITVPEDKFNPKAKYIGYRAHYFELADSMQENVLECDVVSVVEDMFSYILTLKECSVSEKEDWSYIRYELSKESYKKVSGRNKLWIKIVSDKLIVLEK